MNKALEVRTLRDENRELRAELSQRYEFDNIIGRSAAMREIFATVDPRGAHACHGFVMRARAASAKT